MTVSTRARATATAQAPQRLFFCRTPLQALIIQSIQAREPGRDTIIYYPTSHSPKHAHYAKRLVAGRKCFVPFAYPLNSQIVSEVAAYFRVPGDVRSAAYDQMFISSIGALPFAMLAKRNPECAIKTFDDGTFNLRPKHFFDWIDDEGPRYHRVIKAALGAMNMRDIVGASVAHYTVFDRSESVFPAEKTIQVDLFPGAAEAAPARDREQVVVLGTPMHLVDAAKADRYRDFVAGLKPDLYIPHPAELANAPYYNAFADDSEIVRALDECIAEEIVLALVRRGYSTTVHGFSSTALLNVKNFANVRNHFPIDPKPELAALFSRFGIASNRMDDK
jgi:hypothetical protein